MTDFADPKPRVVIINPKPVDPRRQTARLVAKAESFFVRGAALASERAPEAKPRWEAAAALAGCLRAELQRPGEGLRQLAKTLRREGQR